jgi:hypothetical protein
MLKSLTKKIQSCTFFKLNYLSDDIAKPLFQKNNFKLSKFKMFNLYSFGKKNPKKIFYVIKRTPGAGLFSNVIYVLNHILIARKHGFIPFVDFQNFNTIYNEKKKIGSYNSWEYYFKQLSNYKIKDIYNSKKVIITNNNFTFDNEYYHKIQNTNICDIADDSLKIKKIYIKEAQNFSKKYFKGKILGIHYRGTSYKTSANHPFPATKKQIIFACNKLMEKYKYDKIFLCTEDLSIFNTLVNEFKNKIIFLKDAYRSYSDDAFKIYPRKKHRYRLGKEILVESLLLSKCDGFLYASSNVSEFIKYLNFKKKKKYFKLDNGTNSANEYLAKWLWHLKNFFPKILFGFDEKIKIQ